MFSWAYEIPNWQVGAILSGGSVVLMWVGIIFIRPFFRLLFARQADLNAVVGVNRLPNLTHHRRPILTLSNDEVGQ